MDRVNDTMQGELPPVPPMPYIQVPRLLADLTDARSETIAAKMQEIIANTNAQTTLLGLKLQTIAPLIDTQPSTVAAKINELIAVMNAQLDRTTLPGSLVACLDEMEAKFWKIIEDRATFIETRSRKQNTDVAAMRNEKRNEPSDAVEAERTRIIMEAVDEICEMIRDANNQGEALMLKTRDRMRIMASGTKIQVDKMVSERYELLRQAATMR